MHEGWLFGEDDQQLQVSDEGILIRYLLGLFIHAARHTCAWWQACVHFIQYVFKPGMVGAGSISWRQMTSSVGLLCMKRRHDRHQDVELVSSDGFWPAGVGLKAAGDGRQQCLCRGRGHGRGTTLQHHCEAAPRGRQQHIFWLQRAHPSPPAVPTQASRRRIILHLWLISSVVHVVMKASNAVMAPGSGSSCVYCTDIGMVTARFTTDAHLVQTK